MSGEIVREWHFWLVSIATGAFMAFVYDVLRLFRRLVRHGRLAVDLEDILYWTACFALSFTLLYYGNNGVIRFAAVLGAAIGMLLYVVTAGRFFVRVSYLIIDKTIGSLLRLIARIFRFLRRLLRPVRRFVVTIYHKLRRFFRILFEKMRLTCAAKRHKIKLYGHAGLSDKEEETPDVRKKGKEKTRRTKDKTKNTRVSPSKK